MLRPRLGLGLGLGLTVTVTVTVTLTLALALTLTPAPTRRAPGHNARPILSEAFLGQDSHLNGLRARTAICILVKTSEVYGRRAARSDIGRVFIGRVGARGGKR